MSKFYTAIVSNEGDGTSFKVLIKADSIAQARAGAASRIITVDRATDQEIFEAGKSDLFVLSLSDMPTDGVHPDQQPLITEPTSGGNSAEAAVVDPSNSAPAVLIGATKSGSAPNWLQDAVSQRTGD